MAEEIARFGAEVEATIAELGRISTQMTRRLEHLATAADEAASRTAGAAAASAEASANVRDIASAAEELTASVMEIDRQVGAVERDRRAGGGRGRAHQPAVTRRSTRRPSASATSSS